MRLFRIPIFRAIVSSASHLQLLASLLRLTDRELKENEYEDIRKHHLVDLWRTAYCH